MTDRGAPPVDTQSQRDYYQSKAYTTRVLHIVARTRNGSVASDQKSYIHRSNVVKLILRFSSIIFFVSHLGSPEAGNIYK